jgi:hypothetical protein
MVTHSGPLADQAAGRTLCVETGIDVKLGLMLVGLRRLVMGFSVDFHQPCGVAAGALGNGQGRKGIEVVCEHGHLVGCVVASGFGQPCLSHYQK